MKKILFLFILCSKFVLAKAQVPFKYTATNPTGAIVNTSIDTLNLQMTNAYSTVAIQPVVTRLTGTMAGTITLLSSVNGVNYVATGETFTLANQAVNTTIWYIQKPARFYRITVSGATTVTGTASARLSFPIN